MSAEPTTRVVRVQGRVQGVGYRVWVQREAERRGLAGWVRNRQDGSVEALLSGPTDRVQDMIAACRQGPRAAQVLALEVVDDVTAPVAGGFSVRATA